MNNISEKRATNFCIKCVLNIHAGAYAAVLINSTQFHLLLVNAPSPIQNNNSFMRLYGLQVHAVVQILKRCKPFYSEETILQNNQIQWSRESSKNSLIFAQTQVHVHVYCLKFCYDDIDVFQAALGLLHISVLYYHDYNISKSYPFAMALLIWYLSTQNT